MTTTTSIDSARQPTIYTYAEWKAEGTRRFGPDQSRWRFVCPVCRHVASVADYLVAGARMSQIGIACVGHWTGGTGHMGQPVPDQPCNFAGDGLLQFNMVRVQFTKTVELVFQFAPD